METGGDLLLSWSGGKDSALALQTLRSRGVEPIGLLTTVGVPGGMVSHHGVPGDLLELQARSAGLPVVRVELPDPCPNEVYDQQMAAALTGPGMQNLTAVAFGDLFLEDLRVWRTGRLADTGLGAEFPLWGTDTTALAHQFIADGWSAVVCAVDTEQLDASFAGRRFDRDFFGDLPAGVDPCGENGEFHTFVTDGPVLAEPIRVVAERCGANGRFARVRWQAEPEKFTPDRRGVSR